jgi:hypothetical protein
MGALESRNLAPPVRVTPPGASLAWKLNRLRCMSTAEIGHRVIKAAAIQAERWGFVRCTVPAPDLSVRVRPWIHAETRAEPEPYAAAAERIMSGRYDVFAMENIELGSPPRWNRDPKTGIEAPLAFGKQLDYRDPRRVGDIKYLWEPNRHLHLVTLAQAYALTSQTRYADEMRAQLDSWFRACPFRMGPNWSSSLEAGLRLLNWALAWQLVGGVDAPLFKGAEGEAFRSRWLVSIYQHAEFIAGHFSLHSSANNHLIGEAAGLFIASVAWPFWERSADWHDASREILEREAILQNAADGVNREQATSYQQFELDLLLLPLLAARANGDDFPPAYVSRIEAMLGFVASIIDAGGNVPQFGDADDGYAVRLDPRPDFCRFRSLLATGAVIFGRGDFKAKAQALDDKTRWLLGEGADKAFDSVPTGDVRLPIRRDFREGGYYILGCDFETDREIRLIADAGPLGYREIAAHGHADALSFTLSVNGLEYFIDPGTFAYHTEGEWRSYFRGTSAHNTVRIDGRDQSQQGGNFMWLRKARAACSRWSVLPQQDIFEGWHDGYLALPDPVMHRRKITLDKATRRIVIEDTLQMNGEHDVELFFHCHEDCQVQPANDGATLERLGQRVHIRFSDHDAGGVSMLRASTAPIAGWVSRSFDRKKPTSTLVWKARLKGRTTLRTIIDC